jgi:hypothetical protein
LRSERLNRARPRRALRKKPHADDGFAPVVGGMTTSKNQFSFRTEESREGTRDVI